MKTFTNSEDVPLSPVSVSPVSWEQVDSARLSEAGAAWQGHRMMGKAGEPGEKGGLY